MYSPHKQENMDTINRLTDLLDNYGGTDWGTSDDVYNTLWQDINDLRQNNNKEVILSEWKYKTDYEFAENSHTDEQQLFKNLEWEHSFALSILYAIYH